MGAGEGEGDGVNFAVEPRAVSPLALLLGVGIVLALISLAALGEGECVARAKEKAWRACCDSGASGLAWSAAWLAGLAAAEICVRSISCCCCCSCCCCINCCLGDMIAAAMGVGATDDDPLVPSL